MKDFKWNDGNTWYLLIVGFGDIILASSKNEFSDATEIFDSKRKPDYEVLKHCLRSMKELQPDEFDEMMSHLDESSEGYFYAKKIQEDS